MSSKTYWQKREEAQLELYKRDEAEYDKRIREIYRGMYDNIQSQINAFYGRYADAEGLTLAEAKKRISKADMAALERKAKKYVENKEFSEKANEEMRLYNATMRINRLEMLKAEIGMELAAGHDELDKYMQGILEQRAKDEMKRMAGILGETVRDNAKTARSIANASFHNATFSNRLWAYNDIMKADLDKLLQQGLIQGKNPRVLAKDLQKYFIGEEYLKNGKKGASYSAERLMRTELARVQTDAQTRSFIENGFDEYTFNALGSACDHCKPLHDKHFKIADMVVGENAPPLHPNCRCAISAYMDDDAYEAWLDHMASGGEEVSWKQFRQAYKMAADSSTNDWSNAKPRVVTKEEKKAIMEYAKTKGINMVDINEFDGDTELLKGQIDTLAKLKKDFGLDRKTITLTVGKFVDDGDFAETHNETIRINVKALRNRAVTEHNIMTGGFASSSVEDIAAHEFGHILVAIKGNKGIDFTKRAVYNISEKEMSDMDALAYLANNVSSYSIFKRADKNLNMFKAKDYKEIIPEILAKYNSSDDEFVKEFVRLLKAV